MKKIEPEKSRGGVWVAIGDEEYRIPPLAFRSLRELADDVAGLRGMGAIPTESQMLTVEKIIYEALKRNYPSLPFSEVQEMLDVSNYAAVLNAAMTVSGFTNREPDASGEAVASIGIASTSP